MSERNFLAFDLGAESGRAILGCFDGTNLSVHEVHRFPNTPVAIGKRLYWNSLSLFNEMKIGLAKTVQQSVNQLDSVGIDTWGVDFALLDGDDALLDNPRNYRDRRTDGILEQALKEIPRKEIFQHTGVQFLKFNSLYQLLSMRNSKLLDSAQTLLLMPDLFNFYFTGNKVCEFSNATTTQFFDPAKNDWSRNLLHRFKLPSHFLPQIVEPGTQIGKLRKSITQELNIGSLPFIAPATHDTGSAVAAIPSDKQDFVYISSGTWSLMGIEVNQPIINSHALEHNFTNEGGVGHTYRFLKNIMGLWLIQECRRTWAKQGNDLTYDQLAEMATKEKPFVAIINPDNESFMAPGNMPANLQDFCSCTNQQRPQKPGSIIRTALEGLALKYRYTLDSLEKITGKSLEPLHIVGGGIQNKLLCQFTADATNRTVIAGPLEATAIGNIVVQAISIGEIDNLEQGRKIIRNSFSPVIYEPNDHEIWNENYEKFLELLQ